MKNAFKRWLELDQLEEMVMRHDAQIEEILSVRTSAISADLDARFEDSDEDVQPPKPDWSNITHLR